ncbi:hypothetical protein A2U01_0113792, partial [Trifolium medium]|nr:hypothetical protein [Trifolium medium]
MQSNISDSWVWKHDVGNDYSVRGAYHLLTNMDTYDADEISDLIWHKQ